MTVPTVDVLAVDALAVDVLAVGEAMAVFCPDPPMPLRGATTLSMSVAGAEANVAVHLAALGLRTVFRSRVGDDPFGELIRDRLTEAGVDARLETVIAAPTGVYFKDPGAGGTRVHYYRAGSAASTMDESTWSDAPAARLVHLSGITPALSDSCDRMVRAALSADRGSSVLSFDVNFRPRLWDPATAAPILAALANRADIVFVGQDEAETLWGSTTPADVRDVLPSAGRLIVKDGGIGVTEIGPDGITFEPALPVDIIESVGAGDAFAAGYLYGLLTGRRSAERLRIGHHLAANALRTAADVGAPITAVDLMAAIVKEDDFA
jgi:2-dehydro-3-deoxygluconokinase